MRSSKSTVIIFTLIFAFLCGSFTSFAVNPRDSTQKKDLTIAFIFPFNTSKVYISDLSQSKYFFPEETQVAAEFLQGALLAIDSLKAQGLNAKILVYDSGNDSLSIEKILLKTDLSNTDLIFAPFNGYALKAVTDFASREKIPVISPLSVSFSGNDSNQCLILANASMKTHCERMYDYMLSQALTHRTLMVYRKRPEDLAIVKYFKDYAEKEKQTEPVVLKFIEITDSTKTTYAKLRDSLYKTDVNQILIPSVDEAFVRSLLKQLFNLRNEYKFRVYGMPTWDSFDLIPGEQLDSLNTVITSSISLNKSSAQAENFKQRYSAKYNVNPSGFSVRGYDEACYFISQLMDHDSLLLKLPLAAPQRMIATSYDFSSPNQTNNGSQFLENKNIFLLGRENGEWVPLPK